MGRQSDLSRDRKKQEIREWANIHKTMGCPGCQFADPRNLLIRPCCTYPGSISADDDGKCKLRLEKKSGQAKEI